MVTFSWSNCLSTSNDLPEMVVIVRENLLISGKSRLAKYYNLARFMIFRPTVTSLHLFFLARND